jgi:hypothetical protein
MKITIELPDDTICGFVNFVHGDFNGLSLRTLSLGSDRLRKGEATYKSCVNVDIDSEDTEE